MALVPLKLKRKYGAAKKLKKREYLHRDSD